MNAYDGMEKILELTDIIDKLEQVLQIVINYGVREQEEVIEKIIKEYESSVAECPRPRYGLRGVSPPRLG
jgi:predicted transcriptional regulator